MRYSVIDNKIYQRLPCGNHKVSRYIIREICLCINGNNFKHAGVLIILSACVNQKYIEKPFKFILNVCSFLSAKVGI